MNRRSWLYEVFALWFGLITLGILTLSWSTLCIPLYYLVPRQQAEPFGRKAISIVFRIYLRALTLIGAARFDLRELDALQSEDAMIIAPNHPCLLDAVMMISRLPRMTCIMKAALVDNIFLGAGARFAGYIRNDAHLSLIRQSVTALKGGQHLLLFPEGTRTTRWPVNDCRGPAALIAARAGVPIQTVFIETESPYLTKGWPLFKRPRMPIVYRVRLGRRFDVPEKMGAFNAELEQYFIDALQDAPRFLPADAPQANQAETA